MFCNKNSEFWCHEKAHVSKKFVLVGKYAENERFRKMLTINDFRFLYIPLTCQSYAMRLSKLWNEVVIAMLWGPHSYHLSGSKHIFERLRCHMWQFYLLKMRKMERKSRFPTHFSFLDWKEKSTKICHVFSFLFSFSLRLHIYASRIHRRTIRCWRSNGFRFIAPGKSVVLEK